MQFPRAVVLACTALLAALLIAAPRPAQTTAPRDVSRELSAGPTGAPSTSGAPSTRLPTTRREPGLGSAVLRTRIPSGAHHIDDVTLDGIASHVGSRFPASYLALPWGRGVRARVCGPAACVTQTSTDAGPDLAMQRAGRVADLSVRTFERVCGCSERLGLVPVVVTRLPSPTLPATDGAP